MKEKAVSMRPRTRKKCIQVYQKINHEDAKKKMTLWDALHFFRVSQGSYDKWILNFKHEDIG